MEIKEAACTRCGTPIDPQNSYWDEDGQICIPCNERAEAVERFLKLFKGASFGSLSMGLLSLIWNPLFIPNVLAISSGIWAFRYYKTSDPEDRKIAIAHKSVLVAAIIGMSLASLRILYFVLVIGGLIAS